jgi:hypothetical protein
MISEWAPTSVRHLPGIVLLLAVGVLVVALVRSPSARAGAGAAAQDGAAGRARVLGGPRGSPGSGWPCRWPCARWPGSTRPGLSPPTAPCRYSTA